MMIQPKHDNKFGENRLRLAPEATLAAQVLTHLNLIGLTSPVVLLQAKLIRLRSWPPKPLPTHFRSNLLSCLGRQSTQTRGFATRLVTTCALGIVLCFIQNADAKEARSQRSKKSAALDRSKSSNARESDDLFLEDPLEDTDSIDSSEELSVRKIGVGRFSINAGTVEGWSQETAVRTCRDIASKLSLKSYYLATCLEEAPVVGAPTPVFINLAQQRGVDAILAGTLVGERLILILYSGLSGRAIADYKTEIPSSLSEDGRKQAVAGIVDLLVRSAPYRGYITDVDSSEVQLNLGSRHGITPGTILEAFEFVGPQPTFESSTTILGTIEVREVRGPDVAVGRIVDRFDNRRRPFPAFAKVSHIEVEPPRQSPSARLAKEGMGFFAGIEILSIQTRAGESDFADRTYVLNGTPFVSLGVGAEKWFGQFWYGQAANPDESVSYAAALAAYQLKYWGGVRSGLSFSMGASLSQFSSVTKVKTADVELKDTSRYAPYFEFRYQWVPHQRFRLFASVETSYPFISSGQDSAMLPTSVAFGITPGLRFGLNDWMAVESGVRLHYLSLPLQDNRGITEEQTGIFVRALLIL